MAHPHPSINSLTPLSCVAMFQCGIILHFALIIETIMKNDCQQQIVHFLFGRIRWPDTCESALTSSPHAMLTDVMVL